MRRSPVSSVSPSRTLPEVARYTPDEDVEAGGLAGAVGSDDGVHGAGSDGETDRVEGGEAGEPYGQLLDAQRRYVAHASPPHLRSTGAWAATAVAWAAAVPSTTPR